MTGWRNIGACLLIVSAGIPVFSEPLVDKAFTAIERGDNASFKKLVEAGLDVNSTGGNVRTFLHDASATGNADLVKYLISKKAKLNEHDYFHRTPLLDAHENHHPEIVRLLVEGGADINHWSGIHREKLLHDLILENDTSMTQFFIEHGADIYDLNANGDSALLLAVKKNNLDLVKLLIAKGARVNEKSMYSSPLLEACAAGNDEAAALLLEAGAKPDTADWRRVAAIHKAAQSGRVELIRRLLAKGVDKNQRDIGRMTPLHYAARSGNPEAVRTLIKAGALVKAEASDGKTPLHYAGLGGTREIVEVLLENGADPEKEDLQRLLPVSYVMHKERADVALALTKKLKADYTDSRGETLVHIAAANGIDDLVKNLISRGAKLNRKNKYGQTPLHKAAQRGHGRSVSALLAAHADPMIKDKHGNLPIHVSCQRTEPESFEAFLKGGIPVDVPNDKGLTCRQIVVKRGNTTEYEARYNRMEELLKEYRARPEKKSP